MNVLFLIDCAASWEYAPASRLLHLARVVCSETVQARIVGSRMSGPIEADPVHVVGVSHESNGGLGQVLFPFRKELRDHLDWCDVLVVRGYWIGLWSMVRSRRRRSPLRIYDFHGFTYREQRAVGTLRGLILSYFGEKLALSLCDHVLAVSEGIRDLLPTNLKEKTLVVTNGVDVVNVDSNAAELNRTNVLETWNLPADRPVFISLAQFGPNMDPCTVVLAAEAMQREAEFVFVGHGPTLDPARDLAKSMKLPNVHFTGLMPYDQVLSLLQVVTGCICPYSATHRQGQDPGFHGTRKVKEYLAAGKPILVAAVPGHEPFLEHEVNCLHYAPGDPDDLVRNVRRLMEEPTLADRLSRAASQTASQFSWSAIAEQSGFSALFGDTKRINRGRPGSR